GTATAAGARLHQPSSRSHILGLSGHLTLRMSLRRRGWCTHLQRLLRHATRFVEDLVQAIGLEHRVVQRDAVLAQHPLPELEARAWPGGCSVRVLREDENAHRRARPGRSYSGDGELPHPQAAAWVETCVCHGSAINNGQQHGVLTRWDRRDVPWALELT